MVNFPYCIKNAIKYKKSEMRKERERERERFRVEKDDKK